MQSIGAGRKAAGIGANCAIDGNGEGDADHRDEAETAFEVIK